MSRASNILNNMTKREKPENYDGFRLVFDVGGDAFQEIEADLAGFERHDDGSYSVSMDAPANSQEEALII